LKHEYLAAKNNRACILAASGRLDDAVRIWNHLENNPSYLTPEYAAFNLGNALFRDGDLKGAEDAYARAVEYNPSFLQARFALARLFSERGLYSLAEKEITVLEELGCGVEKIANLKNLLKERRK